MYLNWSKESFTQITLSDSSNTDTMTSISCYYNLTFTNMFFDRTTSYLGCLAARRCVVSTRTGSSSAGIRGTAAPSMRLEAQGAAQMAVQGTPGG